MILNDVFLRFLFSVTFGYNVSFTVPLECSLEIFAAERTNVDALSCNLLYSLISIQVLVFKMLSDAPEISTISILDVVGRLFSYGLVFVVYIS